MLSKNNKNVFDVPAHKYVMFLSSAKGFGEVSYLLLNYTIELTQFPFKVLLV